MTIKLDAPIRVTFLDHCEDGSVPVVITAYGVLRERHRTHLVVDSWVPGFKVGTENYDQNVKRFVVVRACVTHIAALVEA